MRDSPVGQSDSKDRGSFSCPHTWLEASVSVSLSWIFYPLKTFQGQSSAQLHNMLSHHIGKRDDTCYSWPSSCIYKFPHPLSWTVTLNGLRPIIDGVMDRNPATQPLLLRKCFSPHIWEMSGWVQCCQRFLASLKILCFHVVTFLWACQHVPMSSSSQLLLFQSSGAQTQKQGKKQIKPWENRSNPKSSDETLGISSILPSHLPKFLMHQSSYFLHCLFHMFLDFCLQMNVAFLPF